MENISTGNSKTFVFSLQNSTPIPKFIEKKDKKYVAYGALNNYPNFLIELYQSSSLHGAIVKSMVEQIKGSGVRIKDDVEDAKLKAFIDSCNEEGESLDDVIAKLSFDYLLFGGFSLYVNNSKGLTKLYLNHIDWSFVRSGLSDSFGKVNNYYTSNDWSKNSNNMVEFPAYKIGEKNGIYVYKPYSPGLLYYPLPDYVSTIGWIQCDAKIPNFHSSNIDNGFFPSVHVAYHNGVPTEEQQQINHDSIMDSFAGGSKAGTIIETYDNGKEYATDIKALTNNDNDQKFLQLAELIQQQILSGWRIPSGELLGIQQVSKLGNGNILEAQELFMNTCIKPKQKVIEDELNYILKSNGFKNEIEIIPSESISTSLDSGIMSKICTINELREMIGKEPIETGDVLVDNNQPTEFPTDNIDEANPTVENLASQKDFGFMNSLKNK